MPLHDEHPSPPVLRGRGAGGEGDRVPARRRAIVREGRCPPHPQPLSPGVPGARGARHAMLRHFPGNIHAASHPLSALSEGDAAAGQRPRQEGGVPVVQAAVHGAAPAAAAQRPPLSRLSQHRRRQRLVRRSARAPAADVAPRAAPSCSTAPSPAWTAATCSSPTPARRAGRRRRTSAPTRPAASPTRPANATASAAATPLPIAGGTLLHGRYRLDKLLKMGGFGAVYMADDTKHEQSRRSPSRT